MRAKRSSFVACFGALTLVICAGQFARPQSVTASPQAALVPGEDSSDELSVVVGKSVLIECAQPAVRVVVGLGDIAVATAMSPTEILLNGKTAGETSMIIWEKGGVRQFFNITVRASPTESIDELSGVRSELAKELPGQDVTVSGENGNIFLRGTVNDLNSSDRAVSIAGTAGKVINLLNVAVPPADQQILLKVRFASVDRNLEKQLGINLYSLGLGNTIAGTSTGQFSPPSISGGATTGALTGSTGIGATFSNELNILGYFPGLNSGADIEALLTKGVVQVLAEPNLLAENGKEASFLAGGEYPYPVVQGGSGGSGSSVAIEFKEYGVRLNFIPTITPRGTIRLQVAPEVSSLDFTNAVEISGFDVPAIDTRKVKTEVELADGQSFIIGGLLDNRDTDTFEKIPFIGDIPILGKFFQSQQKTRTNTELIVIITPEIVNPIPVGAPVPALKFPDQFLPTNSGIPMNTPDTKPANTKPPATTMPIEKLVDSMKPETPLVIDSATSGSSGGSSGSSGSSQ